MLGHKQLLLHSSLPCLGDSGLLTETAVHCEPNSTFHPLGCGCWVLCLSDKQVTKVDFGTRAVGCCCDSLTGCSEAFRTGLQEELGEALTFLEKQP